MNARWVRGRERGRNGSGDGNGYGDGSGDGDGIGIGDVEGNENEEVRGEGGELWYPPHRKRRGVEDQALPRPGAGSSMRS